LITAQRRDNFARYALGLIGDGDRKSMEPIAARACASATHMDVAHQRLQYFITESTWDDHEVRLAAARYALAEMTRIARPWAWIVDDTGFLKQGKHRATATPPSFREGCRKLGLSYAVTVSATTRVWIVDALGRRHGDALPARDLAARLATDGAFRRYTWARRHRRVAHGAVCIHPRRARGRRRSRATPPRSRVACLRVARRRRRAVPLSPRHLQAHALRAARPPPQGTMAYRAFYQDLKGELGLDHFEGRRFRGWHHHVSVARCCFAFLAAERARAFPPSTAIAEDHEPIGIAA